MGDFLSKIIIAISDQTANFWQNLSFLNISWWQASLDILLIAILFYYIFLLFKGSRAVNIIYGLLIISLISFLSQFFKLLTVNWLLDRLLTFALFAIPVIFQQELRMALERIGIIKFFPGEKNANSNSLIKILTETAEELSKNKDGALIVIKHSIPLKEYIETGTPLNAEATKELILTIFKNKSPLHDGAIILERNIILSAGCVLPTSFSNNDKNLGTRHKAAIGITEHTDASAIVISEEKGTIGFAKNGRLEKSISLQRLEQLLTIILSPTKKSGKRKKYKEPN